jgi:hypothetical protein
MTQTETEQKESLETTEPEQKEFSESTEPEPVETPPQNRIGLKRYLHKVADFRVPDRHVCGHHASPMDYLWHAYSCDKPAITSKKDTYEIIKPKRLTTGDCIVWANRGGGKTQLAAVVTLLEGLFKYRCQTRMLAGSLDQSSRMYEYLRELVEFRFANSLAGKALKESCRFKNGATVQVLPHSARAVRGRHIHKLRCDEIELFDPKVFNAAKFITRSDNKHVAAMEMFSTMHRPYGLMQQLIQDAPKNKIPVFKWCVWEVIEHCTKDRSCSRCPLNDDCRGKARRANGYLSIDDCITQMRRSSRAGFESEMLCLRPSLENAVFDEFDPAVHVKPVCFDPMLPLYRAIDFGFTNPFVCLWLQVDGAGMVRVIDEYVQNRKRICEHGKVVKSRTPCDELRVANTFCDPTGANHNGVSGTSEVVELTNMGMRLRHRRSGILEGIEHIRAHLRAGDGSHRLIIDPGCSRLIEAMHCYHYPDNKTPSELPKKDGTYDHPVDALRYFFVNFKAGRQKPSNRY